jgi:hypothetical protein
MASKASDTLLELDGPIFLNSASMAYLLRALAAACPGRYLAISDQKQPIHRV